MPRDGAIPSGDLTGPRLRGVKPFWTPSSLVVAGLGVFGVPVVLGVFTTIALGAVLGAVLGSASNSSSLVFLEASARVLARFAVLGSSSSVAIDSRFFALVEFMRTSSVVP